MTKTTYTDFIQNTVYTPEFVEADDPEYMAFCQGVQHEAARKGLEPVWKKKLHGAWFISETFQTHWTKPTKESTNAMLWTVYHHEWELEEGIVMILAWWKFHRRKGTQADLQRLIKKYAEPVYEECQPYVIQKRKDRNRKRAEQRREKKKMQTPKDKLHQRILDVIREQGKATAVEIEMVLIKINPKWTAKLIESQLYRMMRAETPEVVKIVRGVYALPKTSTAVEQTIHGVGPGISLDTCGDTANDVSRTWTGKIGPEMADPQKRGERSSSYSVVDETKPEQSGRNIPASL